MSEKSVKRRVNDPVDIVDGLVESQAEQPAFPYDEDLLERSRTQWEFGDWESLSRLERDILQHHPDRAKLALLAAAGRLQTKATDASQFIRLAREWGASEDLISRTLIAGVHNSLGRAAVLADLQSRARKHFEVSVAIGAPGGAVQLISKARMTEQIAQTKQISLEKKAEKLNTTETGQEAGSHGVDNPAVKLQPASNPYDKAFYDAQKPGSELSARTVLSSFFKYYMPQSIVDVGCGAGTWLKVAKELGVPHILGLDGEYAIPQLVIPAASFQPQDLARKVSQAGKFELAMSLEVAEHLDDSRADGFVSDLCGLSDVILFSAAIPYQGGTDHRNENWPEYWGGKFHGLGYVPLDFLREEIWHEKSVEWWYRQNVLVFVRDSKVAEKFPGQRVADHRSLARVHPELFIKRVERR